MREESLAAISRAIDGDRKALEQLWRQHRGWLAAVVMAHMPNETELEDIMQEIAVAVVKAIHKLKDPQAVHPWLRSVALNTVKTAGRRTTIDRRNRLKITQDAKPIEVVNDERDAKQQVRETLELLHDLPEHYREPLLLKAVRGLTQQNIAQVLGVPIKTVETRLRRARKMLAEQVAKSADDDLIADAFNFDSKDSIERGES